MADNLNHDDDEPHDWTDRANAVIWLLPSAAIALGLSVWLFRAITGL